MGTAKVTLNGATLMDITDTTAEASDVLSGEVFYTADGTRSVGTNDVSGYAPLASPEFTGTPTAPTASSGTNTTQIATTAFVQDAVSGKADSSTTLSGYGITNAYTKTEVDSLISSVFTYKGTKATYSEVEALTGMKTGDVWFVTADGSEYAYNGSSWEKLGPTIDLSGYLTSVSVAGQTLTPNSNTITASQLKTALGLGTAAYADTESTLTDGSNLPTGAAVKAFVEGKGYSTTAGTVTSVATGAGLTGGTITGSGTIKADLVSETKLTNAAVAATETSGRVYPVALDKNGDLAVNVPWTDNNTWTANSSTAAGYVASGSGQANKVWKTNADGVPAWRDDDNTTYSTATTSSDGLMASGDKTKINNVNVYYGTCSTAADTAAKVVTLTNSTNFVLTAGAIIGVKFSNSNTASSVTLNVDSKGAKSIYYNNDVYTGNSSNICGLANRVNYYMYDGSYWVLIHNGILNSNTIPSAYCDTAAATAAKVASCSGYALLSKSFLHVVVVSSNTAASALTLNVNSRGAKAIYINGSASSSTNYTLPAGSYLVYYDGTNYQFRTDGYLPGVGIVGTASNVRGTVAVANGGTGATTAANARTNLGLGSAATYDVNSTGGWDTSSATVPVIGTNGVFDAGKYIDFHADAAHQYNYDVRFNVTAGDAVGKGSLTITGNVASPALTGTPTAPTAAAGTNTTQLATTAFVNTAVTNQCAFKIAIKNSQYGYYKSDGTTFVAFRSPSGTAAAAQVLTGYTFSNASSDGLSGSMTNRGAVSATVARNSSYTIQAGYHNGSGTVTSAANSGTYKPAAFSGSLFGADITLDMGAATSYRYVNPINMLQSGIDGLKSVWGHLHTSFRIQGASNSHPSRSVTLKSMAFRGHFVVIAAMRAASSSHLLTYKLSSSNTQHSVTTTQNSSNVASYTSIALTMNANTTTTITLAETAGDLGSTAEYYRASFITIYWIPFNAQDIIDCDPTATPQVTE